MVHYTWVFLTKMGLKCQIFRGAAPLHPADFGPLRGRLMLSDAEIVSQLLARKVIVMMVS